ncbi:MAG: efflux RND transporter periplasmic adaptor subunit [Prevotellaceae bacterium]|nr:efflux RND transporter periplasmic adaptor subunit [Prevotellaceae bacterium]
MKKVRLTAAGLLFFVLPAMMMTVSCGTSQNEKVEDTAIQKEQLAEKVSVTTVEEKLVERTVVYPCTLNPFEENYLAPASPGRIEKLYVEIGSHVKQKQVIAQMDRTQLVLAETQLKTLKLDYDRLDTLAKLGSVPKQQFDQIKGQYDIAKTNVDFLLENTQLLAPFAGIVADKYFEDGELYSGTPNTAAGKAALIRLIQIDNLKAFVDIPEQYFPQIAQGMKVDIVSEIYPSETFEGSVFRIHPTIDPTSHNFRIEVKIPNGRQKLRPGMYTHVSLGLGQDQALVVPSAAVLKLQGSNDRYAFIAEGNKAKRVTVLLGKRYDENVEIISNEIKAGDKIIIRGQSRLSDGVEIEF